MGFKANVATGGDRHQRHLQIAPAPGDRTIIVIFLRREFNVERLRLWSNVFDPVSSAHDWSPQDCADALSRIALGNWCSSRLQYCGIHLKRVSSENTYAYSQWRKSCGQIRIGAGQVDLSQLILIIVSM